MFTKDRRPHSAELSLLQACIQHSLSARVPRAQSMLYTYRGQRNKKCELMLMRRATASVYFCTQVVPVTLQ